MIFPKKKIMKMLMKIFKNKFIQQKYNINKKIKFKINRINKKMNKLIKIQNNPLKIQIKKNRKNNKKYRNLKKKLN